MLKCIKISGDFPHQRCKIGGLEENPDVARNFILLSSRAMINTVFIEKWLNNPQH